MFAKAKLLHKYAVGKTLGHVEKYTNRDFISVCLKIICKQYLKKILHIGDTESLYVFR